MYENLFQANDEKWKVISYKCLKYLYYLLNWKSIIIFIFIISKIIKKSSWF